MKSPFEIGSLIDWLETKPPEAEYEYACTHNCLLSQYFRAKGFGQVIISSTTFCIDSGVKTKLPAGFNAIALGSELTEAGEIVHPKTFGIALANAKRLATGKFVTPDWVH